MPRISKHINPFSLTFHSHGDCCTHPPGHPRSSVTDSSAVSWNSQVLGWLPWCSQVGGNTKELTFVLLIFHHECHEKTQRVARAFDGNPYGLDRIGYPIHQKYC